MKLSQAIAQLEDQAQDGFGGSVLVNASEAMKIIRTQQRMIGTSKDVLQKVYDYILREYEAIPTSGQAVTEEIRPLFNEICDAIDQLESEEML